MPGCLGRSWQRSWRTACCGLMQTVTCGCSSPSSDIFCRRSSRQVTLHLPSCDRRLQVQQLAARVGSCVSLV